MNCFDYKKFIKRYNEWLSLPIALVLFFTVPALYRQADATAGTFDAGYLHLIIFAVIVINVASGIAWLMMRLSFPELYKYFDDAAEGDITRVKSYFPAAAVMAFGVYFAYFFAFIIITATIL